MANPAQLTRRRVLVGAVATLGVAATGSFVLAHRPIEPGSQRGNETMRWADRSRGRPFSKDPSVVRFDHRYLMYFSVPPKQDDDRWGQAVAVSEDLLNWNKVGEIQPRGYAAAGGLCAGGSIILGNRVHLFFQTYGRGPLDSICHATSPDGVTFEHFSDGPILRPTGGWNCGRAIDAEAHVIGDELFCYWATRDSAYKIQMLGVHSATCE
ncbi:MAG TPA: hypothetical protein VFP34_06070 [Microlunatus sp.]|nr:hypothetical protein [Microlunatus sp.]